MSPAPPPEEIAELMQFIAEKSKDVKSPMNLEQLCRLFKEETGSLASESCVRERILTNRERIHKMNEFDMDTKVEMMFALSAPITADFLIELRNHAEVDVDDSQRIIRFKKMGGGLELKGRHEMRFKSSSDEITLLMRFLAEKSKNVKSPLNIRRLCRQFKEETGSVASESCLRARIQSNRDRIHEMNDFDMDTKVELMFALSAPVAAGFLMKLKKLADVEVDDAQRIIRFKKIGGGLELKGRHNVSSMHINERGREIIQFLVEKAKTVMTPIGVFPFLREFKEKTGDIRSLDTLAKLYAKLKSTIFELPGIEKITKVKIMFISGAKLPEEILEELRTDAYVEVDIKRRIKQYEAIDGSLKLGTNRGRYAMKKASKADITKQSLEAIPRGTKRARDESQLVEDNVAMDFDTYNAEDFDYDPLYYEKDTDHIPVEKKPKSFAEVKREVPEDPSTSIGRAHYEENFFGYNQPTYEKDPGHVPVEKKLENLIDVKAEISDQPSTSSLEYHFQEHLEHFLIEPKPEIN